MLFCMCSLDVAIFPSTQQNKYKRIIDYDILTEVCYIRLTNCVPHQTKK